MIEEHDIVPYKENCWLTFENKEDLPEPLNDDNLIAMLTGSLERKFLDLIDPFPFFDPSRNRPLTVDLWPDFVCQATIELDIASIIDEFDPYQNLGDDPAALSAAVKTIEIIETVLARKKAETMKLINGL